jgi:hypothetical protein
MEQHSFTPETNYLNKGVNAEPMNLGIHEYT